MTTKVSGFMILYNDIPLDLKAISSLFSEKLPKVISDDKRIAKGKANGTKLAET